MAERVPADIALWKPFSGKGTTPLRHDIVCVHTMVGSLAGSWNWANGAGRSYWHFGVAGWGEAWQCQGLEWRSAANLEGNPYIIPIETADMGAPFGPWSGRCGDVPAWTDAQEEKLAQLIAWLCARYDIPPTLVPDSRLGRRGLAYHRQGIDPWRVEGGLLWSSSSGKCCPDWRRIAQFTNEITPEVQLRLTGGGDWLTMATEQQVRSIVREEISGAFRMRWTAAPALTLTEALGTWASDPKAVNLPRIQAKLDQLLAAVGRVDDEVIAGLSAALAPTLAAELAANLPGVQIDYDQVEQAATSAFRNVLLGGVGG